MKDNQKIRWQHIIELSLIIFSTLVTTITLYLHTDSKIDAMHQTMREISREIQTEIKAMHAESQLEMKDFHGRLCAIEERNKK